MKAKTTGVLMPFAALLMLSVLIFSFTTPYHEISTSPVPQNEHFLFGATDSWKDDYYNSNYNNYNSIGLNTWHVYMSDDNYGDRKTPRTWLLDNDRLYTQVSVYSAQMVQKIDEIYSETASSNLLWTRPKIDWLCYGQSSIYQCDSVPLSDDFPPLLVLSPTTNTTHQSLLNSSSKNPSEYLPCDKTLQMNICSPQNSHTISSLVK